MCVLKLVLIEELAGLEKYGHACWFMGASVGVSGSRTGKIESQIKHGYMIIQRGTETQVLDIKES